MGHRSRHRFSPIVRSTENNTGLFLETPTLECNTGQPTQAGGHTIDDELLADGFIDILLEFHAAIQLVNQVTRLDGEYHVPKIVEARSPLPTGQAKRKPQPKPQHSSTP